jgi:hypothetical protein
LASVESRWGGVCCDLTELARTGASELSVRYRYRNTGAAALSLPNANLVPRTRAFDAVSRTLFGVLKDPSLAAHPGASVTIEGNTDAKGADAYNQALSEQRAASGKQWLVSHATLDGANITTRGWGESKPIAQCTKPDGSDDPEGRAKTGGSRSSSGRADA